MSSRQRLEVWRGTRLKTSGGLTKADLVKNKRGKIVSKKKSSQASSQNNLGAWLRETGKTVPKADMLRKKADGLGAGSKKAVKQAKPKQASGSSASKKAVKQAKPKQAKPKAVKQAKPKRAKPKAKPEVQKKRHPKITRAKAKAEPAKGKINPLTKQPYAPKSGMGYVAGGNVSLDNVRRTRLRPRKRKDLSMFF